MLGNFGMTEMMMLLLICLVLFGAKRIPEIGSSIGKGIREFKRGVSHLDDTVRADEPRTIVTSAMLDAETESGRAPKRLVD
jgi:sec-independent protein translocase protein TatA